jgi:hypothetical protein
MTEDLVSEEEAIALTKPIWRDLARVWRSAFAAYNRMGRRERDRLAETPFVPMVTIFGFAQSFASQIFSGRESESIIRCDELGGIFAFYVRDRVLLRFNSVDRQFIVRHSQSGTDRKSAYFRQEPIFGLNNAATRLTVGSVANAEKTEATSVVVSCQVGDDRIFAFPIDRPQGPSRHLRKKKPR